MESKPRARASHGLYWILKPGALFLALICSALCSLPANALAGQELLSLDRARSLALEQNNLLKIARSQVEEKEALIDKMAAKQFPKVSLGGFGAYNSNPPDIRIRTGELDFLLEPVGGASGPLGFLSPLPGADIPLVQGSSWPFVLHGTVIQPLSMLPRIHTGVAAARIEKKMALSGLAALGQSIGSKVEQCYCALQVTEAEIAARRAEIRYGESRLHHGRNAVELGELLAANLTGLEVELLEARMELEKELNKRRQLVYALNLLIGRPVEGELRVEQELPEPAPRRSLAAYLEAARRYNPEMTKAGQQVALAEKQIIAVKQADYPEIYAFGSVIHQEGAPLISENFGLVGLGASWDLLDFGASKAERLVSRQQKIQALELEENTARVVENKIASQYSALAHADALLSLAKKNRRYRLQLLSLARDQVAQQLELDQVEFEARWKLAESEAELQGALAERFLALQQLERLAGGKATASR
ncbi:TolC family protein [Desulfogranum mediterraneum]|uniref:TolC family protein n=1 Tax=Desulfogranum mediterraneum TaxID=160661 RepID=UPI00040FC56D|nr:TolC family protein [Desulfogranum mediterraneum]